MVMEGVLERLYTHFHTFRVNDFKSPDRRCSIFLLGFLYSATKTSGGGLEKEFYPWGFSFTKVGVIAKLT